MASVTLKNIRKVYDKSFVAVDDFNLEIEDKEFIVLVGPSGCGKSTTLRMIAGLEDITGGELYIGDRLVNEVEPKNRNIAMVFQNYALYPHMTVYDNIAFGLKMRKEPKKIIDEKVRAAAEILEISDLLKRKPKALSGGQRQRVAIARALSLKPDAIIADEPTSALDVSVRAQILNLLMDLKRDLGLSMVFISHDIQTVRYISDRIIVMNAGVAVENGTAEEVFSNPKDEYTKLLLGAAPSLLHPELGK